MKSFADKVYEKLLQVPAGKITTYKQLATALSTKAYQAVGQALRNNPHAPTIPCHRVVTSAGLLGGFDGKKTGKTVQKKKRLLQNEGIAFVGNKIKNFEQVIYIFVSNE